MQIAGEQSEDSGASEQARGRMRGGGRGRGKKIVKSTTPTVKTRSQRLKDSNLGGSSMSTDSQLQSDSRRSLWKEDTSDISSSRSACASIIDKYRLTFNGKAAPRIPLCRLEAFTRVRKLQLSLGQAEELKRSFRLNGYMESCHGFHVSPVDEDGREVLVIAEEESSWDFFWKTASQDFDHECRADPDLAKLAGKKFKVWDGNHRVKHIARDRPIRLDSGRRTHSPSTIYTLTRIQAIASEVMAAQRELSHWEKEMESKGEKMTEEKRNEKWEKMLTIATRHWNALIQKYATIVNPQLGPEFLSTVRGLHSTLAQQEKGKREVKVEVGVDRVKTFAAAPVPPDLKVQLLKVHYSGDLALKTAYHHPPGNDLDDIRPWLNQWGMWAMLETYCLSMLAECVRLQPETGAVLDIVQEEEKFLKHVQEYRSKFWSDVWYLGDRNVLNDARRAKRLFFRYAVWIRTFDVYHACFLLWRSHPKETISMFSNDDKLSRKWEEISDWKQENCPFYVDYIENPPVMFDEWEELCYARRIDLARAQYAIEEAATQPELLPELYEAQQQALEKLPEVFDSRKLQLTTEEEALDQAKIFEPKVDQVLSVFAKLKRKKVAEEPPVKTPAKSPEQTKEVGDAETDPSSAPLSKSTRKERRKKVVEQTTEATEVPEPAQTVAAKVTVDPATRALV
ncbi:hypothetical protein R1sor_018417 [Riccia sorocarpa]|uniref:Uncharacterized protein n=1 Tax=Riccia sorocarpa TaxID=122646 RepID=A0ABD3I9M2_9MARC